MVAKLTWIKEEIPLKNWKSSWKGGVWRWAPYWDYNVIGVESWKYRKIIKERYRLIKQLETKLQSIEDDNHQSESNVENQCKMWIARRYIWRA